MERTVEYLSIPSEEDDALASPGAQQQPQQPGDERAGAVLKQPLLREPGGSNGTHDARAAQTSKQRTVVAADGPWISSVGLQLTRLCVCSSVRLAVDRRHCLPGRVAHLSPRCVLARSASRVEAVFTLLALVLRAQVSSRLCVACR